MSKLIDKKYYEENPQYSELNCFKCKTKTMRLLGIESFEDYDREDKILHQCEKCGQFAYIDIEWIFIINL